MKSPIIELSKTALFNEIDEEDIEKIIQGSAAEKKTFAQGQTILQEGETTDRFGIVLKGKAVIEKNDFKGNNNIISLATEGEVFAEAYACASEEKLMITVRASEETQVLFLDFKKLCAFPQSSSFDEIKKNAQISHKLMRNMLSVCAGRCLSLSRRITHTMPKTIRGKLLSYFFDCAKKAGSQKFTLEYDRQGMADYLGTDRSAMCAELSKMKKEGLIEYDKKTVELTDDCVFFKS